MPETDAETRARAHRLLALPPPPEPNEHGETLNPFDANGAPDLSDVSPRYIREIARTYTREALDTLLEIMQNQTSSDTAKISCAKEILLRGWGSPGSEADMLKIWLDAHAPALAPAEPPTQPEPLRFVMPMTVDGIVDSPEAQDH